MPDTIDELKRSLRTYIATLLAADCQGDNDSPSLAAVRAADAPREERIDQITEWLRVRYHVLMHFTTARGREASEAILSFAEQHPTPNNELRTDEILRLFAELESALCAIAPRNKDGSDRDVTSLTSKALWLCFPESIPIYDAYAASALAVLSRLLNLPRAKPGRDYPAFVETWKLAYEKLMPAMEQEPPCKPVRAFDRWLCYLGEPGFN